MAAITSIDGSNYASRYVETPGSRVPVQQLGQDEFLQLVVAQMTSQDPLSPKGDFDFIGQMASFSSLEQARSMTSDLARLRADQELLKANALLGRTVQVQVDAETRALGTVSAVQVEAGTPKVVVGDQAYDLNQIVIIGGPPAVS